ncbi:hypothetical protein ACM64Y_00450 [Novispirillum sp. DQ9]|uniref:hypothetical protein n=1 Tax=Novispirillum sp. DQ9 TaxID=3398612 RepID=UPI003C7C4868
MENYRIEWTDHTFNAWTGCRPVSPAWRYGKERRAYPLKKSPRGKEIAAEMAALPRFPTGADFKPRPVAIHASQGMTRAEYEEASEFMASVGVQCPPAAALPRGAIIGAATLTAVVDAHDSPWFFGPRGLVLADAYAITPIAAAGALGFFRWAPGGQMAAPRPWMTSRDLLGAKPPRKPARVLMHVYDAGNLPGGGRGVCFRCCRCGHDTGWVEASTLTEDKRGRPCPSCNGQQAAQ